MAVDLKLLKKYQQMLVAFGTGITHKEMDEICEMVKNMADPNDATVFLHQVELLKEHVGKNLRIVKKITDNPGQNDKAPAFDPNRPNHTPEQKKTISKIHGMLTRGI